MHAFADGKRNVAVFEVVVEEPSIEQHTMIMLAPREEAGQYIVRMTSLGHARATLGMHRAVEAVGEWVAGLDEAWGSAGAEVAGVRGFMIFTHRGHRDFTEVSRGQFPI